MTPSLVYSGKVRHRRYDQKSHQFTYKLFMFCFDINAIQIAFRNIKMISVERFNWFSFRRKDYLDGSSVPLDQAARELIHQQCHFYPSGKIFILTNLACLGYCFNPISLYFAYKNNSDIIEAFIVEVKNTPWMEKYIYVQNLQGSENTRNHYSCRFEKKLHVSPFMEMNYEYKMNFTVDARHIIVHMESLHNGKMHFDATLSLEANKVDANNLLILYPWMTYKITAAIYWQAFKLWLKGVPFHSHPKNK